MQWIVKASKASIHVQLQNQVTPGRWQPARIGESEYEFQWEPMLSTIFIRQSGSLVERAIGIKSMRVSKDPDSLYFETEITLETSSHLPQNMQVPPYIKAEICVHTPGLDAKAKGQRKKPTKVRSPMVGKVLFVHVRADDQVKKGQTLFVIEAMKMENIIKAPCDGIVEKLMVSANDQVHVNDELMQLKAND